MKYRVTEPEPEPENTQSIFTVDLFNPSDCVQNGRSEDQPETNSKPHATEPWPRLLFNYTQGTSLHGVRFITEECRFLIRNIMWLLVVGSALGFLIYYTQDRVRFYLSFQKSVSVEVNYLQQMRFPAVTFCNQNAFKLTAAADHGWYDTIKNISSTGGVRAPRQCDNVTEFRCGDGTCVQLSKRCDIFPDCTDRSDETQCEHCPLLLLDGPTQHRTLLPEVVGHVYVLQEDTYSAPTPVYIRQDEFSVFIYHYQDRWVISSAYMGGVTYAYVTDSVAWPQQVRSPWFIKDGTSLVPSPNLTLTCAGKYEAMFVRPDSSTVRGLTLDDLYMTTAHRQKDMLTECKWKGKPCADVDVKQRLTDMGVCYTYNSRDMFVEQAGPGYGLTLTINIEQYEYTKNKEDGIGVKLLLHDADDVTLMSEIGTAVSPGLLSYISVETTEVINLAPPWGTCGESDLKYYDSYSVAKCKTNCETERAEKCGCRDMYMPSKAGAPPYCDINSYVTCEKPEVDRLRAAGDQCDCPTPCVKAEYVPTTSFSIIKGPDTSASIQNEEMFDLQQRLFSARETRFRVEDDKYRQSMRNLHIVDHQLQTIIRFFEATRYAAVSERTFLLQSTARVNGDCMMVREMMDDVHRALKQAIKPALDSYYGLLKTRGQLALSELTVLVDDLLDTANEYHYNPKNIGNAISDILLKVFNKSSEVPRGNNVTDLTWNEYVSGILKEKNTTAWTMYTKLVATLAVLKSDTHGLSNIIRNVSVRPEFRLHSDRLTPLQSYVSNHCPWCSDSQNSGFMEIVKSRVLSHIGSSLYSHISNARQALQTAFQTYLSDLLLKKNLKTISGWADPEFYSLMNTSEVELQAAVDMVDSAVTDTQEASDLIVDLTNFLWQIQCQTELKKLAKEQQKQEQFLNILLNETILELLGHRSQTLDLWTSYNVGKSSLESVGVNLPFLAIKDAIDNRELTIDRILNNKWMLVQDIHNQIKAVCYTMMTSVEDRHLASASAYWRAFGTISPEALADIYEVADGNPPLLPNFHMVPNDMETQQWDQRLQIILTIRRHLSLQAGLLRNELDTSQRFFSQYIADNQLGSDFYENNFLQVEIFYKELAERSVSQHKTYELANLLGEIGGFMGLLMGASVLSICEILDLFLYNLLNKYL